MATDQQDHEAIRRTLIDAARGASQKLLDTIDSASVADCMTKTDDAGWNSRDHLAHVTAWKRGVIFPLQGRSVAEGMGVSPQQAALSLDELNDAIRQQSRDQPIEQVVKRAIDCQRMLQDTLESTELGVLERTNGEVAPALTSVNPDERFLDFFRYCIVDHLDLHREYISRILSS